MSVTNVPAARIVFSEADRAEILRLVDESLQSGSLTLGPHTKAFEAAFAELHQVPYAAATNSGTSALEIIVRALDVAAGGEIVVPTNTFFATAAAVHHAGGRVRLADVDSATLALSRDTLAAALTPETVGVVLVHIGGAVSPDTPGIVELCRERGIWLVEDAAHAHGASLDGRAAGTFGVAGAFSFYPTKVITSGEGGMITTADPRIHEEALIHRDQGKAGFLGGDHVRMGSAWRLSEVHAAIGLVHLRRLPEFIARRSEVAAFYDRELADIPGLTALPVHGVANFYKYVALLDPGIDRPAVKQALREAGVTMSGEVYASPLHAQPVFAGWSTTPLPVAEDVCRRHVCLPLHSDMSDAEATHVVTTLRKVMGDHVHA